MQKQRLIDANDLIDFIDVGHLRHPGELCFSEIDVVNLLLHAPTVDAVEVVRCEDCMYCQSGENEAEKWEYCTCHNINIGPHAFCSFGDRKEGADNA